MALLYRHGSGPDPAVLRDRHARDDDAHPARRSPRRSRCTRGAGTLVDPGARCRGRRDPVLGLLARLVLAVMASRSPGETRGSTRAASSSRASRRRASCSASSTVPGARWRVVLGLAPVRYVGRISYGLYLWHYPLFLWWTTSARPLRASTAGLRVGVTFAMATASFYLVERPIRHGLVLRGAKAVGSPWPRSPRPSPSSSRARRRRGTARGLRSPPSRHSTTRCARSSSVTRRAHPRDRDRPVDARSTT